MNYDVYYEVKLDTGEVKTGCFSVEADCDDNAVEIGERLLKQTFVDYEIVEIFVVP